MDPLPGGQRGQPRGLLRPDPDHVRRNGWPTRRSSPSSDGPGRGWNGPGSRARPWARPRKLKPGQLEAVRRMREGGQPAADCRGLRVLSQHRPQDIAAGRSGAMTGSQGLPARPVPGASGSCSAYVGRPAGQSLQPLVQPPPCRGAGRLLPNLPQHWPDSILCARWLGGCSQAESRHFEFLSGLTSRFPAGLDAGHVRGLVTVRE